MNVLFLTHRLPYAPNRGDRMRAYFMLKHMHEFATVDVVSLVHDSDEAGRVGDLHEFTASARVARVTRRINTIKSALALLSTTPTTHTMLDTPAFGAAIDEAIKVRRPDVVLAYCSSTAKWAMRPPLATVPMLLDLVDVDSAKWRDLSVVTRAPLSWVYRREARVLAAFESSAAMAATATLVTTDRERESLLALAPRARVEVMPQGIDVAHLSPKDAPASEPNVVFCGVMNYAPNEHAALLLGREIWPRVRAARPDATLTFVGSQPTAAVQSLVSDASITVTGAVPDVRPYLWRAAVAAAPIVTARGIQNKVLEAVAAGLPTVVTPNIAAALPPEILPAVRTAEGAPDLASALLSLLALSPHERRAIAQSADLTSLTWSHQLQPMQSLLAEAAARGRR